MKRIIVHLTTSVIVLVAGCSRPDASPGMEKSDRYIFFSQDVGTKASLIGDVADMNGQKFGVVGFRYDNGTTYEALTSPVPNVFCDEEGNSVEVETLTCDGSGSGSASYTPLQGWSNSKKYAFFAYYPIENPYVTLVNTDGSSYTSGTPAIKYTMDADNLRTSMADVMTAPAHIDKYWNSSSDNNTGSSEITFAFRHCLSCIGLNIRNSTSGEVKISSVTFTLSGIKHRSIIIPLDGSQVSHGSDNSPMTDGLQCSIEVEDEEKTIAEAGTELSDKLIFIPQSEAATVTVAVEYTRSATGYETFADTFTTSGLSTVLTAGVKHLIYLTFTDSTVEVSGVVTEGGWETEYETGSTFN